MELDMSSTNGLLVAVLRFFHYRIQQLHCSIYFLTSCVYCIVYQIAVSGTQLMSDAIKALLRAFILFFCFCFVHYDWHWAQFESVRWFVFDWDSAILFFFLIEEKVRMMLKNVIEHERLFAGKKSKQIALSFIAKWMPFLPFFMTIYLLLLGKYAVFDPCFFAQENKTLCIKAQFCWMLRCAYKVVWYTIMVLHSKHIFLKKFIPQNVSNIWRDLVIVNMKL